MKSRFLRVGKWFRATARFMFTIGACVNFAVAAVVTDNEDLSRALIALGLFNLSVIYLFLDRDNPPEAL